LTDLLISDIEYSVIKGVPGGDYDNAAAITDNIFDDKLISAGIDAGEDTSDGNTDGSSDAEVENEWVAPLAGEMYGKIVCEDIELDVPLYYDDSDAILKKGAGHSVLSYFPGQGKTVLVGAHDTTFFAPIENIEAGMEVKVMTVYGNYAYKVAECKVVETSSYEIKEDTEQLVLYTCYPFGEINEERTQKFIVICDFVSGKKVESNRGGEGHEQ